MKRVIVALILLAVVTGGSVVSFLTGEREFNYLIHLAQTAEDCYRDGDVDGALEAAEALAAEYPRRTRIFALFMSHQALTDLEKSTASLPLILLYGEPRDFTAEARRCRLMLEHLWQQEKPAPENII